MPRLCILTQYFPPEMGAPQARLSELGERLVERGWEIETLTALPNYPTGQVFAGYHPFRTHVECVGRIRTVRVPIWPSKSGFLKRIRMYMSFVASSMYYGPRLCNRPDLLFVESPPLFIGYAARYLSRRWRCPYIFNVSDLWPESAIRMGVVRPGLATRLAERLELSMYRNAIGVAGQSEEIVESVRRRSPGTPTQVITNGVDTRLFSRNRADEAAQSLLGSEPGPIFIYAGLFGLAQGLDQVLDIAASTPESVPGRFVLVGEGPEREHLLKRVEREAIPRVRILPAQPRDRIPVLLAAADVAVITLRTSIPGAVPSKIYEAMASSLPILLIADGEASGRVEAAGCGIAVPPGDLKRARETCQQLATDEMLRRRLGEAGRQAAETLYDRVQIAKRLDEFLRSLLTV